LNEEGKELAEKAKEGASKAVEQGKTGLEKVGEEIGDIVKTAEEVGKEIWEDIVGVFDGGKKGKTADPTPSASGNNTQKAGDEKVNANSTEANTVRRRSVRLL
jgi:hypothetical protein